MTTRIAILDDYQNAALGAADWDHPLRGFENAVLTGHTGYVVKELYALAYGEAVEDIQAWIKGDPVRVLNAEAPP